MEKLTYITHETQEQPKSAVIWLHGLGASGDDFAPIVPLLNVEHLPIRFIFPNAHVQPVSLNAGLPMPAWFDIFGLDKDAKDDEPGILQAEQLITQLIHEQNRLGIPTEHIFLFGYSQGGALAMHTGLRFKEKLAGIVGLSTYLPLRDKTANALNRANRETPIFLAHGQFDDVVKPIYGSRLNDFLIEHNYIVERHTYPMAHAVLPEEINDISIWLQRITEKMDL